MQISDRTKDVIKSGGEWISSVELENEVMAHPGVVEAAVIAVPDERWSERPLVAVVARGRVARSPPTSWSSSSSGRVSRWWLPERWAFVDEVPKTSVGKFDKKVLRAQHADGRARGGRGRDPGGALIAVGADLADIAERLSGHRRGAGRPGPRPPPPGSRLGAGRATIPTRG